LIKKIVYGILVKCQIKNFNKEKKK